MSDQKLDHLVYEGVCGRVIEIEPENPENIAVTLRVDSMLVGPNERDESVILLSARIFKHIFKQHFSPHILSKASFYVVAEIPEDLLVEEWKTVFDKAGFAGAAFRVTTAPVENPMDRLIPRVVETNETSDSKIGVGGGLCPSEVQDPVPLAETSGDGTHES